MYPFIKNNGIIANEAEAVEPIQLPFLVRQTKAITRSNEESFNLYRSTLAQAQDQPLQIIVSPGVDMNGHAYFWVGLRVDRNEVDLKLLVNPESMALVFAPMCGIKELPVVENLAPMKIADENRIAWYQDLQKQLMELKAVRKERIEVTENGTYLKVTYKLAHGKMTFSQGKVENLLDLLKN